MKNCFKKNQKGFTLLELLVAIMVFMIILIVATNSYVTIVRAQREANEMRLMYSELRDFVDFVNAEMRNGKVDQDCYFWKDAVLQTGRWSDASVKENDFNWRTRCDDSLEILGPDNLMIVSKDETASIIIKYDDAVKIQRFAEEQDNDTGQWSNKSDGFIPYKFKKLQVTDLSFEKFPTKEFDLNKFETQTQSAVWMNISVQRADLQEDDPRQISIDFQTLLTSRSFD